MADMQPERRVWMRWVPVMFALACETPARPTPPPAPSSLSSTLPSSTAAAPSAVARPPRAERPYLWFAAKSKRAPLVMFLHGYGSSPEHAASILTFDRVARDLDVHIAVPAGTTDRSGLQFWHASDACCDFDRSGVDDVRALRSVIAETRAKHDVSAVFVVGFSNGAFMAHRLACDASEDIDGFAAVAGVGFSDPKRCRPTRPLSMLQIHGTNDRAVDYEGGHVLGRKDVAAHPGAASTMQFWVQHDRCGPAAHPPPPHIIGGLPTSVVAHASCQGGTRVALWTIAEGGHLVPMDQPTMKAAITFLLGAAPRE